MTVTEQLGLFEDTRPPYYIRSMAERQGTPTNGLVAVSTFSGSGGSSLGLKSAGWTIPYAVEFTPQGKATYEANHPTTFVDQRDIRDIDPQDILDHLGLKPGELDLLEGSPPCSSFSAAGVRAGSTFEERVGKVKLYSAGIKQRTDDLFEEWVRLAAGLRPKALLAENVPDMLKGDHIKEPNSGRAYLYMIQSMLGELGYDLHVGVYSSLWVGCATMRKRLILIGLRKDIGEVPRPKLSGDGYTLREALDALPGPIPEDEWNYCWADGTGKQPDGSPMPNCKNDPATCEKHIQVNGRCAYTVAKFWAETPIGGFHDVRITLGRADWNKPCPTFTAAGANSGASAIMHPDQCRRFTATETKWMSGFPYDYVLTGTPADRYERVARAVTPPLYEAIGPYIERAIKTGRA